MKRRRRKDSGYALLLVLLMGAIIAISLYLEIPRVAFEAQRQKEQLLIDRGEQYKRAIRMFLATNKRYPGDIKDLESFNNRRFLRKRFVDPMTGKDEWRIIHIVNGVVTDSLVNPQKPNDPKQDQATNNTSYVGVTAGLGQAPAGGAQQAVSAALRRRASDGQAPGIGNGVEIPPSGGDPNSTQPGTGVPGQTNPAVPGTPGQTGVAGSQPYPPGVPPGMPGVPTAPPGVPGVPGQPVIPGTGVNPATPTPTTGNSGSNSSNSPYNTSYMGSSGSYMGGGSATPAAPGTSGAPYPGQPVNSQTGGVSATPYSTNPGANGPSNSTAPQDMINRILTSPRPGGMPTAGANGQVIGGGIAGVASTVDEEGIMSYNDRTNYKEWEFLFDPLKVKPLPNPLANSVGTPAQQLGNMSGSSPAGTPISPTTTPSLPISLPPRQQ